MSNNTRRPGSKPETHLDQRAAQPFLSNRRRKDRHGRKTTGNVFFPSLPGWKTRREVFDQQVALIVEQMSMKCAAVSSIEFAVEEVPPSGPAPWEEHDVCLARVFPRDRTRHLNDRIVIYRQAVLHRCTPLEETDFIRLLVAERISHLLVISPEELLT